MAGTNVVILRGRVGNDPEVKRFNDGNEIAEFSLATSKTWKDGDGNRKEKTEWHKVKVSNKGLIEIVRKYVNKGSSLCITGALEYRKWEKDGDTRIIAEVVVGPFSGTLDLAGDRNDGGSDRGSRSNNNDYRQSSGRNSGGDRSQSSGGYGGGFSREIDDEIPFAPEWRG